MKLPKKVDDPSLLQDEPLCNFIATAEQANSRSETRKAFSTFAKEMQESPKAAAAAKRWAYLLFKDVLSKEHTLQVTDGGQKLYEVFLKYQFKLHGDTDEAFRYQTELFKGGIKALGLKYNSKFRNARTQGKGNKGQRRRALAKPKHSGAGSSREVMSVEEHPQAKDDTVMESSTANDIQCIVDNPETLDTRPETHGPPAVLLAEAKQNKSSTSRKNKKRKASSQKPPVISPSDASEDDTGLSTAPPAELALSLVSHSQKRIASKSRRLHDQPQAENQAEAENSARPDQQDSVDIGVCEFNSLPRRSRAGSNAIVTPRRVEGRRGVRLAPARRKHGIKKVIHVPTRVKRTSFQPIGSLNARVATKKLQFRASKRTRRESMSDQTEGLRGGSDPTPDDLRNNHRWHPIQARKILRLPSAHEKWYKIRKLRKKRTRLEFEAESVASDVGVSNSAQQEPLGVDVRETRPLPRKLCIGHSPRAVNTDLSTDQAPSGTQSLEDAERLLRDSATNALVVLEAKVGPDEPDWTQAYEVNIDCDGLSGLDQGEDNDVPVTSAEPSPSSATSKPPLPAAPRIWAQSRQEVCESFEYFRSYHGGVYSKNDIVKGYLLGAFSASRDLFHHGGRLIISHGGGKSESIYDARLGPRRYLTDQDQEATDRSVRALLKTWKDRRPLALLADDKYAHFPYDLAASNYTYVVLGLYWISNAWAECQLTRDGSRRVVRWKFAFQWCEGQGDPWWIPQHEIKEATTDPLLHESNPTTCSPGAKGLPHDTPTQRNVSRVCELCQKEYPTVYRQGWMCLNPCCNVFWSIDGEDPQELEYAEEFLDLIPQSFGSLPDITPTMPIETSSGVSTTYACSKGWHCPNCGRLSCRYKWEHWECSNCQVQRVVKGRLRSPKEFWHQRPSRDFLHSQVGKDSGIIACRLEPVDLGARKGFTNRLSFILPHDRGKIHLILGTPLANGDADVIFQMYQEQASTGELKLRRYPLRNHRARGQLLTNYFSQNSGEPYQYVGGTGNTVPFHEAPDCVRRALALIKERASLTLHSDIPFNEVLSAAYMERQKMSFHSDSEKGLGPTIASLSLGSAALIHFRQHAPTENLEHPRAYALTLVLRHGDVLIMEGDGVQKYYEHTVIPMNFRIAATARCIGST